MGVQDILPESAVTDISTNWQSKIIPVNNSSGMSFPSLQHRFSVSVTIASHILEQAHQSMFRILAFLEGQSPWGLFCFSSSSSKRFSTSAGILSGSSIYGDNKIKQNKAQYDLDRQTAKISALSSENVSKYEFLTWKYVLPKKNLLEKAAAINRFEYSPLGKELKRQASVAEKQYQKFDSAFESNKKEKAE